MIRCHDWLHYIVQNNLYNKCISKYLLHPLWVSSWSIWFVKHGRLNCSWAEDQNVRILSNIGTEMDI